MNDNSGEARSTFSPTAGDGGLRNDLPASNPVSEIVAGGIVRVSIPLPFPPRQVNAWLVDEGDGWLVIDAGWDTEEGRQVWREVETTHFAGKPPKRLLLTHRHPDHVGLAAWLAERWQLPIHMARTEWLESQMFTAERRARVLAFQLAFLHRSGVASADIEAVREAYRDRPPFPGVPEPYYRLRSGQVLKTGGTSWKVMIGRGHSPEMVCLYSEDRGILISADQILPRITPHIGLSFTEANDDPLGDFLQSLDQFRSLPETVLVLPSHGDPFVGPRARLDYFRSHHAVRLARLMELCAVPSTASDATAALFKPQPAAQLYFAVDEAAAHLRHLEVTGQLRKTGRGDGVWLYQRRD